MLGELFSRRISTPIAFIIVFLVAGIAGAIMLQQLHQILTMRFEVVEIWQEL